MQPITYNLVMDNRTGMIVALGRNGRKYTMLEIQEAQRAAERGDADAVATMAALDHTGMSMEEIMKDCPCCREEREQTGRQPEPILAWTEGEDPPFAEVARDPNWWHGRKRRRRARHRGRR